MAKIKLTIKTGDTKESVQYEIDSVTTLQMMKLKNEISAILKELKANGELTNVLEGLFNAEEVPTDLNKDDAQAMALEKLQDQRFITGMAGAFDKLLETVPDRAFNILSILSGIDKDTLEKVPFIELMDIYDAIMEENDIVKIVERVKKSFFGTKEHWGQLIQKVFKNKQ